MSTTKKYQFGHIRTIPEGAEESRIIPFVLSTATRDRHGTILNQDNWDLDNYLKNPIVAYQHTLSGGLCSDPNPDFVIGKSIKIGTEGMAKGKMLVANAQFEPAEINPLAEKVFRKLLFGSISRSSVGFLPVGEGAYGEGEEAQGKDKEVYYFHGQELLEWSVVNLPSNPDAGKRDMLRRMREEGFTALMYAFKELGGKFRLSQLEQFRVVDILDMLDGKDLELKETNPDRIRLLLSEVESQKDQIQRLQEQLKYYKTSLKG
jgi:hypothetical protein